MLRYIRIFQPDDSIVAYRHIITGRVHPKTARVQVLVYSADGAWYLQQDAVVRPSGHWSALCTFGDPESRHAFTIVALALPRIRDAKVHRVPADALRSKAVRVVRVA